MSEARVSQVALTPVPLTRREFLNYAWLASLGFVFVAGFGGATFFFAFPRFEAGQFGGIFTVTSQDLPALTDGPKPYQEGKFWLIDLDQTTGNGKTGVVALYKVCTHLGCIYNWVPVNNRFECPCHGSKFQKDGTYIEGPAPRNLDRMVVRFLDASEKELAATNAQGDPLQMPEGTQTVVVETGEIIQGKPHG